MVADDGPGRSSGTQYGLFIPPFGELAHPRVLAELAGAAERSGWDGFYLWDHVLRPGGPRPIADVWVALSAIAMSTRRIRLGPMVTPMGRRRVHKLARETVSLDHLSGGRLVFGAGLGVDTGRELSAFNEVIDLQDRGAMLDEGLSLLTALWTGEEVHHRGRAYMADGVTFLPTPVQSPRIPIWLAARQGRFTPARRAGRYDGIVPIEVDPETLAMQLEAVVEVRGSLDGFDVAVPGDADQDPRPYVDVGATWWLVSPPQTLDSTRSVIANGPPRA